MLVFLRVFFIFNILCLPLVVEISSNNRISLFPLNQIKLTVIFANLVLTVKYFILDSSICLLVVFCIIQHQRKLSFSLITKDHTGIFAVQPRVCSLPCLKKGKNSEVFGSDLVLCHSQTLLCDTIFHYMLAERFLYQDLSSPLRQFALPFFPPVVNNS